MGVYRGYLDRLFLAPLEENKMKRRKTKHNKVVRRVAAGYKSKKYAVRADLLGYKKPHLLGGRRADVEAKKGRDRVFVEVETSGSMKKDKKQRCILRKHAKKKGARFRVKKT